jgi:hypothetical protein
MSGISTLEELSNGGGLVEKSTRPEYNVTYGHSDNALPILWDEQRIWPSIIVHAHLLVPQVESICSYSSDGVKASIQ